MRTMFDARNSLTRDVSKQLRTTSAMACSRPPSRATCASPRPQPRLPVTKYARFSRGSQAYRVLAKELIRRQLI